MAMASASVAAPFEKEFRVPDKAIGIVIGKGGSTLKALQRTPGISSVRVTSNGRVKIRANSEEPLQTVASYIEELVSFSLDKNSRYFPDFFAFCFCKSLENPLLSINRVCFEESKNVSNVSKQDRQSRKSFFCLKSGAEVPWQDSICRSDIDNLSADFSDKTSVTEMHFYSRWGFSVYEAKLRACLEPVLCRQQETVRCAKIIIRFGKQLFYGSSWSELQHGGFMSVEHLQDLCRRERLDQRFSTACSAENDMNFLSSWHGSLDPHPRTWEAQFKSGIQTIAVVAVREGLIQLGSLHKIVEDLNFVIFLQRKFNYLQSIPGVFAIHPPLSFDLRRSKMASSSSQENPSCDGFNNHGDHHDKICPSPTKDLNHPHSHTQLAGMKRPPDQFIDMSKQNTVPALYGSCLSPNKAMNAGWNTRQASINNNSTIVLPLMQPSMSSLQALLSKLPSVTSAEQTSSHFPVSLEAVRGVSSLNSRNPVTNPLESSEASSFQKSCLTLNSTAHMSTSPSGHADFADSKLHVRHQEATGSNSSSHHGGLCPNFLDSCSNPLQLHENHGDLETNDDAYHSLLNQIIS